MHVRTCVRAAAVLGVAAFGSVVLGSVGAVPGVGDAHAAEFYTRKRVNGQWITGKFPKNEVDGQLAGTRSITRPRVAYARLPAEPEIVQVLPPPRAAEFAVAPPVEADGSSEIAESAGDRLTRLREALVARAGELAASVPTLPGLAVGLTGLDPRPSPPAAVEAPAAAEPAAPVTAAAVPSGLTSPLKAGGPKAASQLDPAPGFAAPVASHPVAPAAASATPARVAPLEPKSVSYDFERGIKTTVYESSVVREPFDPAAAKALGARLPAAPVR